MSPLSPRPVPVCGGPSRREWLRAGSLGLAGLTLPQLWQARQAKAAERAAANERPRARSCIVLFLLGGPPQHETWDPKPDAPLEVRGNLNSIPSSVPGVHVGELMPRTARLLDKIAVLRACRTGDNAHSTSGYYMSTGMPHIPRQIEGAAPGAPNNWPCWGGVVRRLLPQAGAIPNAITLPEIAANDGNKTWPGQDAGFLGRSSDPWVLGGDAAAAGFQVPDLTLLPEANDSRFDSRRELLSRLDARLAALDRGESLERFGAWQQQAVDLLRSPAARAAFDLSQEPEAVRERYGRNRFGQGVLLARRLVEAGVSLVQVNWTRIDGAPNNGHWDTHTKNAEALQGWLMPRVDAAYSALLDDLAQRGLLEETLVLWTGEFGRTPKINPAGGRDHWGNVFSVALAGGGVSGGVVHGSSDRLGAEPRSGLVTPADISATLFHLLGISPQATLTDQAGRAQPVSRGQCVREILL